VRWLKPSQKDASFAKCAIAVAHSAAFDTDIKQLCQTTGYRKTSPVENGTKTQILCQSAKDVTAQSRDVSLLKAVTLRAMALQVSRS